MFRLAKEEDIEEIMIIVNDIKTEMKEAGNPQWHEGYPLEVDFLEDVQHQSLYVYEESHQIVSFMCIQEDTEDDYECVEKRTKQRAYLMHRLGVAPSFRRCGIAQKFMLYAESIAKEHGVTLMKADTEVGNEKMNALFLKLGYVFVSTFHWSDNDGTYKYYEKVLGDE
ncbi:MAG: GNAT family N-acetyltransferase [Bacilli bacterium]|nr:GNAT family N-acetyltransferase [Bacilli bacterium]